MDVRSGGGSDPTRPRGGGAHVGHRVEGVPAAPQGPADARHDDLPAARAAGGLRLRGQLRRVEGAHRGGGARGADGRAGASTPARRDRDADRRHGRRCREQPPERGGGRRGGGGPHGAPGPRGRIRAVLRPGQGPAPGGDGHPEGPGPVQPRPRDLGRDGSGDHRADPGVRGDGGHVARRGPGAAGRDRGTAGRDAVPGPRRLRGQGRPVLRGGDRRHGHRGGRGTGPVRRALPGIRPDLRPGGTAVPVRDPGDRRAHLDGLGEPGAGHPARDHDLAPPGAAVRDGVPAAVDGAGGAVDRLRTAPHLLHPDRPGRDGARRPPGVAVVPAGHAGGPGPGGVRALGGPVPEGPRPLGPEAEGQGGRAGGPGSVSGDWGVRDLEVRYGNRVALSGVSLEVRTGEVAAVVGGDGAGKTSLLRALAGAVRPTGGTVERPGELQVGYVSAGPGVYGDLTCDENLAFAGSAYGLSGRDVAERADALLRRTGLGEARGRLVAQLSGGMRQKLALAVGLLHRPELLVLDEPTTGVDPVSRADLWRLISSAAADGAAVLFATTYLDEAERAGEVLALDAGTTLARGTPEDVVRRMT